MTVGYCAYHKKWMEPQELRDKSCRCKENTGEQCRHLMYVRSTKQKYHNPNKGGVRK